MSKTHPELQRIQHQRMRENAIEPLLSWGSKRSGSKSCQPDTQSARHRRPVQGGFRHSPSRLFLFDFARTPTERPTARFEADSARAKPVEAASEVSQRLVNADSAARRDTPSPYADKCPDVWSPQIELSTRDGWQPIVTRCEYAL